MNIPQETLINDIFNNFISALTMINFKLLSANIKGEVDKNFDPDAFLDKAVAQWKIEVKSIIQKRVNDIYEDQKEIDKTPQGKILDVLYGPIDIEDVQQETNEVFRKACIRVDEAVEAIKQND